jgi:hypothetical protein
MSRHFVVGRVHIHTECSFRDLLFTTAVPSFSCRHPSIRTRYERLMRSVHFGCSRYSRRCHLFCDLSFDLRWKVGQGKCAVAGTRRLAVMHSTSLPELCRCQSALERVVKRLILLAADPEMM